MPFYTTQPSNENFDPNDHSIQQDQPPLFIFPGVLGNKSELKNLADQLYKLSNGNREIHIYDDPRLNEEQIDALFNQELPADEQAKLILSELPTVPFRPFPFLLVGYSYGCTLAVQVAQYLKMAGHDPHVFLIDGPSPSISSEYFQNNPLSATQDLIDVLNYAAKLSSLEPLCFEQEEVRNLAEKSFENRLNNCIDRIVSCQKSQNEENLSQFKQYVGVAKQNLKNFYSGNKVKFLLDKINVLLTNKTIEKFSSPFGGWDSYAKEINVILDKELADQTHTLLLTEKNFNCNKIAYMILEVFNKEVKKEDVFAKELNFYLTQYKKNHPDVDVANVLVKILNSQQQEPSSADHVAPQLESGNETEDPMRIELDSTGDSSVESLCKNNNNQKNQANAKARQKFSMFTSMEVEENPSLVYNTRTKAKERAERLGSPTPETGTPPKGGATEVTTPKYL